MYYPILIDLSKFKSLVIGGGKVATRKVLNLIQFSNIPKIISPELCDDLKDIIALYRIDYSRKKYEKGDLRGFNLVFAATGDRDCDLMIESECKELDILLNVADVPELCSFILPATIKKANITISVSSQGTAPFYAKYIKENIEKQLSPQIDDISALAEYFRFKLIKNISSNDLQKRDYLIKKFLDTDWERLFNEKKKDEVYKIMNDLFTYC